MRSLKDTLDYLEEDSGRNRLYDQRMRYAYYKDSHDRKVQDADAPAGQEALNSMSSEKEMVTDRLQGSG